MVIDATTIMLAGGIASLASGFMLILFYFQKRWGAKAACAWGIANASMGAGVVLIAVARAMPDKVWISALAYPFLGISAPLTWMAARLLGQGSLNREWIAVGAITVVTALATATAFAAYAPGLAVHIMASAAFYVMAIAELRKSKVPHLSRRLPLMAMLGLLSLALIIMSLSVVPQPGIEWFRATSGTDLIHFVGPIYAVGSAVVIVLIINERETEFHREAARSDPLTGMANRRALWSGGERLVDEMHMSGSRLAALAFDLDDFKSVNDRFGHPVGDRVIRLFAEVLTTGLRSGDLAARIGGEEFVALLPNTTIRSATEIAERIRSDFHDRGRSVDGLPIQATTSIGLALLQETEGLDGVIAKADLALYKAKRGGKNRVEVVFGADRPDIDDNVYRIA
ncbi:GGDEF domain-containing protein [Notoacmeibacter ruber]|uniref:diguanylate cyclase n=1 Tax=Notoacmeibacter ruber TaxID=2670375 RepID=A0A3L7J3X2_9HYPH|nr:GGDEF domain-containing protein [Notoacmeibacter ruber]RLQ85283.1 GGDEF domain-containing protein [Notoacmeibacter ruber]